MRINKRKYGLLWNLYLASKCARWIRLLDIGKVIAAFFTLFLIVINTKRSLDCCRLSE